MSSNKKDKDTEKFKKNINSKEGMTIVISDFLGCPKKNKKRRELSSLQCKSSTFKAVKRFLMRNKKNMVVFIGNFFGTGPYVIDTIVNISKLKRRFEDRVKIILGSDDISKLRFKYELDRDLIGQDITEWPCKPDINIKTEFDKNKRAFVFGREVNFKVAIEKELKRKQEKSLILILYERIKNIILHTQNGIEEFSFLIDKNLYDLYFLAESDQNIELQLYTIMLSTFLIVYPFVFDVKYYTYLSKQEIENILNILVENIQMNIEKEMEFRDDIYIRKIYDLFQKIKTLNQKDEKYKYGFTCHLNTWRKECNYFFKEAKLIDYDFTNCRSIFTHNFSILYILETYLPFLRHIYKNKQRTEDNKKKYTNIDYYKKYMEFFEEYCKIKSVKKLFDVEKTIYDDPINYNKKINEKVQAKNIEQDVFQVHSASFMTGGSGSELKKSGNNSNGPINKSGTSKKKEKKKKEYLNNNEKQLYEEFKNLSQGELLKSPYNSLDIRHVIDQINRYYKREIIEEPSDSKNELFLNLMVSMQVMYIVIDKVSNNCNYLHPYKLAQLRDIRKILHFKGYYNIFIGGYISGLHFPLVIENNFCANLVFPHTTLVKKEEIPVYKFSKFMLSDFDDFKFKANLRLKNLPITSINNKGNIIITSLTNDGLISNSKTFLGEYFSHTFDDMFLSHKDNAGLDLALYEKIRLNVTLLREQVNADLLPIFDCNRVNALQNKTYLTQDLTYFIKLDSKDKKLDNMYLILDLRKRGEIDKIGTYFGNIHEWFGFFWDEKRLYQKTISKPDYDNLKYYLKQHTAKLVNLYYDKTKEYFNLYDILQTLRNQRINREYFYKYTVSGFDPIEFDKDPGILPNCGDLDDENSDLVLKSEKPKLIKHEYLDYIKKKYNEKFNPVPPKKTDPSPKKTDPEPPPYSEIDFEWLKVSNENNDNFNNSYIYSHKNENNLINKITVPVFSYKDEKFDLFKDVKEPMKGGAKLISHGSFGEFYHLDNNEKFGYKMISSKDLFKKKQKNCNPKKDSIFNEILINLYLSIQEDEVSNYLSGIGHINKFLGLLEIRIGEGTELCYKFFTNKLNYNLKDFFKKQKEILNSDKIREFYADEDFDKHFEKPDVIKTMIKNINNFYDQIKKGLEFLHNKHVYHLDISGSNIIIEEKGDDYFIQIIDFGLSIYAKEDKLYDLPNHKHLNNSSRYKSMFYTYTFPEATNKILNLQELKKCDNYSLYFLFFFSYIKNNEFLIEFFNIISKKLNKKENKDYFSDNVEKIYKKIEELDKKYFTELNEIFIPNSIINDSKNNILDEKENLMFFLLNIIVSLCLNLTETFNYITKALYKKFPDKYYNKIYNEIKELKKEFNYGKIIIIINYLTTIFTNKKEEPKNIEPIKPIKIKPHVPNTITLNKEMMQLDKLNFEYEDYMSTKNIKERQVAKQKAEAAKIIEIKKDIYKILYNNEVKLRKYVETLGKIRIIDYMCIVYSDNQEYINKLLTIPLNNLKTSVIVILCDNDTINIPNENHIINDFSKESQKDVNYKIYLLKKTNIDKFLDFFKSWNDFYNNIYNKESYQLNKLQTPIFSINPRTLVLINMDIKIERGKTIDADILKSTNTKLEDFNLIEEDFNLIGQKIELQRVFARTGSHNHEYKYSITPFKKYFYIIINNNKKDYEPNEIINDIINDISEINDDLVDIPQVLINSPEGLINSLKDLSLEDKFRLNLLEQSEGGKSSHGEKKPYIYESYYLYKEESKVGGYRKLNKFTNKNTKLYSKKKTLKNKK